MRERVIRVLMIDDDPDDYLITRDLLASTEETRFALDWARTYEEAVDKAGRPYDVCLMDYCLGARNGLELLAELRKMGCSLPVILLSGNRERHVDLGAMNAGATDYLTKGGLTAPLLERSIRYAIQHTRVLQELRASEERYALSVRGANTGLWDWNLQTNAIFFSPRWKAILGYEEQELRPHIDEWLTRVHPDDLKPFTTALNAHLAGHSSIFEHEYRMMHKDGTFRWTVTRGTVVRSPEGAARRIAGSHADVTVRKLTEERSRAAAEAALNLRTVEALALAIEAKDATTQRHLERVQTYAMALAEELNLPPQEVAALRAAALLHDIGKLAVPEYIIAKPGKLTPEEFARMKIHPVVGAEIVERIQFPYPVAPIVRHHHEKWDGTGYPAGLAGEQIPIGARILAAVDCLDALASDRQYRRALPLSDAIGVVTAQAGSAFDPKVIEILARHYEEWEQLARSRSAEVAKLSTGITVTRGERPAAGFETSGDSAHTQAGLLALARAAGQDTRALHELARALGVAPGLQETMKALAAPLQRLIPYDALAVYVQHDRVLVPTYVDGDNAELFSSLAIPAGQGLSGWVAENAKPIINGNPSVEPGYLDDPTKFSTLRSALAAPLEGAGGVAGVITLYHSERDVYHRDHLEVLLAIASKLSLTVDHAARSITAPAATDHLTCLPNARSLFLRLGREIEKSRRAGSTLQVLVGDLDGFRRINVRSTLAVGNQLLATVARELQENCPDGFVARIGGDEFAVLLPQLPAGALPARLAQLSACVRKAGQEVCGEPLLGFSIGVAEFPNDGGTAEEVLAEAELRMYQRKRSNAPAPSATRAATMPADVL